MGIIPLKTFDGVTVLRLLLLYTCTKFRENISKSFTVIERTRFVTDGRTDGRTDRQLWKKPVTSGGGGEDTMIRNWTTRSMLTFC